MFKPTRHLGHGLPDLIDELAKLDGAELDRAVEGRVDLYAPVLSEQSITCRPATMLMETVPQANLPQDHPDIELSGVVLEEYLGGGGQGWVYSGRVVKTQSIVAVKVLRSGASAAYQAAIREAELCSRIRHRNILRVFQTQMVGPCALIIMEFVQGKELSAAALRPEDRRGCFAQLADALCCLLEKKVVHCDIKPANILCRSDGSPVIVDFGVAHDLTVSRTLLGLSGTPYFMAPDVFTENMPHPSWDAYSLGVTASMLLVGKQKGATSLSGIEGEKVSGKFDRRLRLKLAEAKDEEMRNWILALIAADADIRLAAIDAARRWSKI